MTGRTLTTVGTSACACSIAGLVFRLQVWGRRDVRREFISLFVARYAVSLLLLICAGVDLCFSILEITTGFSVSCMPAAAALYNKRKPFQLSCLSRYLTILWNFKLFSRNQSHETKEDHEFDAIRIQESQPNLIDELGDMARYESLTSIGRLNPRHSTRLPRHKATEILSSEYHVEEHEMGLWA